MPSQELVIRRVSPNELQSALPGSLLLDVRTPGEFASSHIAGAVLHPLDKLNAEEVEKMSAGKSQCVVICQSGKRATQAAEKLKMTALPGLSVLEGGVSAWEGAGLPLERGHGVISLERQVRIAAGALVLTGALLGYFVNPAWIALSGAVGAGLIFAGVTDTCGMGMLLARMPWNNKCASSTGSCCSIKK